MTAWYNDIIKYHNQMKNLEFGAKRGLQSLFFSVEIARTKSDRSFEVNLILAR